MRGFVCGCLVASWVCDGMDCCCLSVACQSWRFRLCIYDMFLNHPPLEEMQNPITIQNIQQHQFIDDGLNQLHTQDPRRYPTRYVQDRPIICYLPDIENERDWKIALPTQLIEPTIRWYHEMENGTEILIKVSPTHCYHSVQQNGEYSSSGSGQRFYPSSSPR